VINGALAHILITIDNKTALAKAQHTRQRTDRCAGVAQHECTVSCWCEELAEAMNRAVCVVVFLVDADVELCQCIEHSRSIFTV